MATASQEDLGDDMVESTFAKKQMLFGEEAIQQHPGNQIKPVVRGAIDLDNEGAMENLWDHIFKNVLKIEPEDFPFFLTACPGKGNEISSRQWLAEILFEKYKVKSLAIMNSATLSLMSTGRSRGLVVESGEGITSATPVFEGFAIPHATFTSQIAGQDITKELAQRMKDDITDNNPYVTAANMKIKCCRIAANAKDIQLPDTDDAEDRSFELPDGTIIEIGKNHRYGVCEQLFTGDTSMQTLCQKAIDTCDDSIKTNLSKVVFAGGTTMIPGMGTRLKNELVHTLQPEMRNTFEICADPMRYHAAWIGGSMLGSLSTVNNYMIGRAEYEEGKGDLRSIVANKAF